MGEFLAHVLAGAIQAVVTAWRGALHSTSQRVVRHDPLTVVTASLSASLFVPSMVGAGFFFKAVLGFIDDDLFWFFGMIVGLPLAVFLAACALVALAAGVAVGAWLLTDRPLARVAAAVLSSLGIVIGLTLIEGQSPVAQVIGQATLVLALPLLLFDLIPRRYGRVAGIGLEEPGRSPASRAAKVRVRQRFVL